MKNITKDTQLRVVGAESKSPLVSIDEVAEYINAGGSSGGQSSVKVDDITDATNAGTYNFVATFTSTNDNYKPSVTSLTAKLIIEKYKKEKETH